VKTDEWERLLPAAGEIARAAGRAILAVSGESQDVRAKADGSPLTRADAASHAAIAEGLDRVPPRLPVLSEEGDLDGLDRFLDTPFWLVDPLDGTKEFLQGFDDYTVNIALIEKGQPVLGVVYIPATDTAYRAVAGRGAHRQRGGEAPEPIRAASADRPRTAVVSRSHSSPETAELLGRLGVRDTVARGSSVKICAVADGAADFYPRLGPTCLWDTAAGAVVAREAGCCVTDLRGVDLSYDPRNGLKHGGFHVFPATMRGALAEVFGA
jgi:3'(2'), 5'-bisphosphate nucleotidase